MENIKEKIAKEVEAFSQVNGGLSESVRNEIIHMIYIGYLDGHTSGVRFAQDCLEKTFKSE